MEFPRSGSRSVSLPIPPLVERLSWKREGWLAAVRARSGPGWVGLDAVQSFAAQRAIRWARFLPLRRSDMAYFWEAMRMEHVFPVLSPSPRLATRFLPAIVGVTQDAPQPSPPFPVGRMPALMPRPSPGRPIGDNAALASGPTFFTASRGMAPLQIIQGRNIPAAGPIPLRSRT